MSARASLAAALAPLSKTARKGPQSEGLMAPCAISSPEPPNPLSLQIRQIIGVALHGADRKQVAERAGISPSRLDSVCKPTGKNLFAWEVVALCGAVDNNAVLAWLAAKRGCVLVPEADAALLVHAKAMRDGFLAWWKAS